VPLSRPTIWRKERKGEFPKRRRISAGVVVWVEGKINNGIIEKTNEKAEVVREEKTARIENWLRNNSRRSTQ
jgi:CP4-57 regulatory protein AlpA